MRGDGPCRPQVGQRPVRFPPHARGWTVSAPLGRHRQLVSPACAGMDLLTMPWDDGGRSFPRMRGDGPESFTNGPGSDEFPPHARGWTCSAGPLCAVAVVSPACAGMDLSYCPKVRTTSRFPRMRGDGPPVRRLTACATWFPPHARGWTVSTQYLVVTRTVSPACAGMDRDTSRPWCCSTCFPRMRGDGPL